MAMTRTGVLPTIGGAALNRCVTSLSVTDCRANCSGALTMFTKVASSASSAAVPVKFVWVNRGMSISSSDEEEEVGVRGRVLREVEVADASAAEGAMGGTTATVAVATAAAVVVAVVMGVQG